MIYIILWSTNEGVYKGITQCNQMIGEIKNVTTCRKSVLQEIVQYMQSCENVNNIVISRDYNHFIRENEIQ